MFTVRIRTMFALISLTYLNILLVQMELNTKILIEHEEKLKTKANFDRLFAIYTTVYRPFNLLHNVKYMQNMDFCILDQRFSHSRLFYDL